MIGVYVAGASHDWQRARAFMDRVRAHPRMRITHDWTISVEAATVDDDQIDERQRVGFARADLAGIAEADVFVLLLDTTLASTGRWVELGYALRIRDDCTHPVALPVVPPFRIIVSGGHGRSIFTALGLVDFECMCLPGPHDDDAFAVLTRYAKPTKSRTRLDDLLRCPECASADVGNLFGLPNQRCYQCGYSWETL